MLTRREFLIGSTTLAGLPAGCGPRFSALRGSILVNDIHSQLNPTPVERIVAPQSVEEVQKVVREVGDEGRAISIAGGRHAMGGQQFGTGTVLVDMTAMSRVLRFDAEAGTIEVEAGIHWPQLIEFLVRAQSGRRQQWGIIQKQTGADRLSIGGAFSANVHGRGLRLKPFIADVESFVLVDARGDVRRCDRRQNPELFRLAAGGYGLFGIIAAVTLRLAPRRKLERVVEVIEAERLTSAFERRIADGFLFGDFQYATEERSDAFLRKGVFSCYRPLPDDAAMPEAQKELSIEDWNRLLLLSHTDKGRAFQEYAGYYLSTSGQRYWSDTHQLSVYIDDYHQWLDRRLGAPEKASEMITEIYVPRPALARFLEEVRSDFRENRVNVIYGTIRLIERDDESFLAWAKEPYACVIFNLHVVHSPQGLEKAAADFRRLIDLGIRHGGSYYLTYHRFATRQQVEACYPQFPEFLRLKRRYDPEERFQNDWYRHYRAMFSAG
jgi:FAD/FMN-containing dehydrogenase